MEVLKWSSLLRDILPRVGCPVTGGRTCQSIPTKRKKARDFINGFEQEKHV